EPGRLRVKLPALVLGRHCYLYLLPVIRVRFPPPPLSQKQMIPLHFGGHFRSWEHAGRRGEGKVPRQRLPGCGRPCCRRQGGKRVRKPPHPRGRLVRKCARQEEGREKRLPDRRRAPKDLERWRERTR